MVGRPAGVSDAELLATGAATKAQIAKLFRRDAKTMDRLLYGLIPAGTRRGANVYAIEEAAERLVKPGYSIEGYIRKMHHTDLPALVSKEFWNGLRARQTYEKESGDLWPTSEVMAVFAATFAEVRMALMLLPDEMARETTLTSRQGDILKRGTDATIVNIQKSLVDRFADYEPPADRLLPQPEGGGDRLPSPQGDAGGSDGLSVAGPHGVGDGDEDDDTARAVDDL